MTKGKACQVVPAQSPQQPEPYRWPRAVSEGGETEGPTCPALAPSLLAAPGPLRGSHNQQPIGPWAPCSTPPTPD